MHSTTDKASKAAAVGIRLLGRFRIAPALRPSEPFEIVSRRGRALLAYLGMHLDQPVPRSQIVALLWEDRSEKQGRHSLRQVLTELRSAIGKEIESGIGKDDLVLASSNFEVDAVRFQSLCRGNATAELLSATELYSGDLTRDIEVRSSAFEEWIEGERRRLHALAVDTFERCIRCLEDEDGRESALAVCERLLALDPIREATHRRLISLELAVNGRGSALERAESLATILRDQLGVRPEPATETLVAAIAADSGALHAKKRNGKKPATTIHANTAPTKVRWRPLAAAAAAGVAALAVFLFADEPYRDYLRGSVPNQQTAKTGPETSATEPVYSIAILPFDARTDDAKLRQLLVMLEQDMIDTLSHLPRFRTISYQTMRTFRGSKQDARTIGKELGVSYLLTTHADAHPEGFTCVPS